MTGHLHRHAHEGLTKRMPGRRSYTVNTYHISHELVIATEDTLDTPPEQPLYGIDISLKTGN